MTKFINLFCALCLLGTFSTAAYADHKDNPSDNHSCEPLNACLCYDLEDSNTDGRVSVLDVQRTLLVAIGVLAPTEACVNPAPCEFCKDDDGDSDSE